MYARTPTDLHAVKQFQVYTRVYHEQNNFLICLLVVSAAACNKIKLLLLRVDMSSGGCRLCAYKPYDNSNNNTVYFTLTKRSLLEALVQLATYLCQLYNILGKRRAADTMSAINSVLTVSYSLKRIHTHLAYRK